MKAKLLENRIGYGKITTTRVEAGKIVNIIGEDKYSDRLIAEYKGYTFNVNTEQVKPVEVNKNA